MQTPPGVQPAVQVELFVSCANLKNKDLLSKSDPIVVLYVLDTNTSQWKEYGRTEMIKDCLNPEFTKTFIMDYRFEIVQQLKFSCYDVDNNTVSLEDDDHLGDMICSLGEIAASKDHKIIKNLVSRKGKPHGSITVRLEPRTQNDTDVVLQFEGCDLAKKDFFGKSDPFLIISRKVENENYTAVHRTEYVLNDLNPVWHPFKISLGKLCNGDCYRPLMIECYDWNRSGNHSFIGRCETTLADLIKRTPLELIDRNKKPGKQQTGRLKVLTCHLERNWSFLDYIYGGCEVSLIVSVDFTASNGHPNDPTSLHYISPNKMNDYQQAIKAVGEVLAYYDSKKLFPAFGFGARMPNGKVSHLFALNGNQNNVFCHGVDGILHAYQQAMKFVTLYGPTNFAPTIEAAIGYASQYVSQHHQKYFILLIITDGVITDLEKTIEAVIRASSLPLSIVIVGVGNANFDAMDALDSDDKKLSFRGKTAERDIVQFVPFNKFKNQHYSYLAREVLAEIPKQMVEFFKKKGIVPHGYQ